MKGDFCIDNWLIQPNLNRIADPNGNATNVTPKAMEVLVYLARHPGELLVKERIIQAVWPETFVTDDVLAQAISGLRKAFDDDAREPRVIQTIPRRGYRLMAPVRGVGQPSAPDRIGGRRFWTMALAGSMAALLIVFFWSFRKEGAADVFAPEPLTSYPGVEGQPTFSPDGTQVAFIWNGANEDNFDVYVKAVGSEQPLRLTTDPAIDGSPEWSPDGRRIAFLRRISRDNSEVRLVPPTGGPERVVAAVQAGPFSGLAWFSDSQRLAVEDRSQPGRASGLILLNTASGHKKPLVPSSMDHGGTDPVFSPDGRRLAFQKRGQLYVVPTIGGEPTRLVDLRRASRGLAWTAGQDELLFSRFSWGSGETAPLWRVKADGGRPRQLAGTSAAIDPAVSSQGGRLAYARVSNRQDIWRIDLFDDRPQQNRIVQSTRIDTMPQLSPDGESILFASTRSGRSEIWLADRNGSKRLRLTDGMSPRWSPDGESVAFNARPDGGSYCVFTVNISGGPVRQITQQHGAIPTWSNDGNWIYFASNRSGDYQLWKVPLAGGEVGEAQQVTQLGGDGPAIESADGRYLYYSKRHSNYEQPENAVWRIPVEGGEEQPVIDSLASSRGNWDLTEKGIYYIDLREGASSPGRWVVYFLRFDDGNTTEVAELTHRPFLSGPALDVSTDGRWLLSAQVQEESDLMLVESFH